MHGEHTIRHMTTMGSYEDVEIIEDPNLLLDGMMLSGCNILHWNRCIFLKNSGHFVKIRDISWIKVL